MRACSRAVRNTERPQRMQVNANVQRSDEQRRRARRNAWLLAAVAAAFYVGFVLLSLKSVHG
jgi:hypothetical protein